MIDSTNKLFDICKLNLGIKGLDSDSRYSKRLKWEIEEIDAKNEADYFLNLYESKTKYPKNQNNLLVCWLLDIVKDHDIDKQPFCEYGEYPDIDVDYLPEVRDYLKNTWAGANFGSEYVCNIGNYTTFGIKSALLDMARVHSKDKDFVQAITKNLDVKDDEGKALTWDTAMRLYPDLKKYCEENPEVADATRRLIHRNRGMGVHAGGLIIANQPLSDLVPLVKRKENPQASAWSEGLHGQDLSPVGLVKFDLLAISNLLQIARGCEMVKKRHGLSGICNKPGESDWTDVSMWRNDPKALAMANEGDLKCIFQFDSDGMRGLVRAGGVDRFEDLVAYTALFRPGPLGMKMQERYVERKRGRESYALHPLVKPILEKTYGVLCVHQNAYISMSDGREVQIKDVLEGEFVHALDEKHGVFSSEKVQWAGLTKKSDGLCLILENGLSTIVTDDHEIYTARGWVQAQNLDPATDLVAIPRSLPHESNKSEIAPWLGNDEDVSYLIGMLIGDGCMTGTRTSICTGMRSNHDLIIEKIRACFPKLTVKEYFHCRSWYISLSGKDLVNSPIYGNRKTKFGLFIDDLNLRHASRTKSIPDIIMQAKKSVRAAFLAGLFDADGTLNLRQEGTICAITSTSDSVLNGIRKLLLHEAIYSHQTTDRIYIWNTVEFAKLINPYTVIKNVSGNLQLGSKEGWIPRSWLIDFFKNTGLSQREFSRTHGIDRQHLKKNTATFVRRHIVSGLFPQNDVNYVRIKDIKKVYNQQFYDLTIENHHNFIADGIIVHNCYQEQIMRILNVVGEVPLKDCELVRKAISKKKIEGFIKYKEMFILNGQRNLSVSEEEINHLWNQIESFAEYGFNLSHAVAYTYISSWLLYLKAHYPNEFYAAMLSCETLSKKIKEYKMEAKIHGIEMHRLDINKSSENFELKGDTIFYGLSNVKGIGEGPAKKIVENQPYRSFEDFLSKFGTDASVLKPLIGLRCFKERDAVTLWKFVEHYKDSTKKLEDKKKRYEVAMIRYEEEFKELLPSETRMLADVCNNQDSNPFDSGNWKELYNKEESIYVEKEVLCKKDDPGAKERIVVEDYEVESTGIVLQREVIKYYCLGKVQKKWNRWKELRKLWQRRSKSIERYQNIDNENRPKLSDFNPNDYSIDSKLLKELRNTVECEEKFYGFAWIHELELSPDYTGNKTFESLKNSHDTSVGPVELQVKKVSKKESKKGNIYFQVSAEDVTGNIVNINIFMDDWLMWHEEFGWEKPIYEEDEKIKTNYGNLLRVRLNPPTGNFTTFTLESNYVGKWRGKKKFENKQEDYRVVVMAKNKNEEKILSDEEALEVFGSCIME